MHSTKTSQMIDENEKLLELVQKTFTKQLLFDLLFTDIQVHECLEQRKSLKNFLNLLSTSDLREALIIKEKEGDLAAYQRRQQDKNKINVKDLTINQLVKRNWALRRIPYDRYKSHNSFKGRKYMLRDHYELGTNLVEADPHTYQIGKRSGHFNHAKQIQRQYKEQGPQRSDASQSEFEDSQERNDGEEGEEREYDDEDSDDDEDDDFIDDRKSEQLKYEAKNAKKTRKMQKMKQKRPKLKKIQDSDDIEQLIHDHEREEQDQAQKMSQREESSPIIEQSRTRNLRSSKIPKQSLLTNYLPKKTEQQKRPSRLKRVIDSD